MSNSAWRYFSVKLIYQIVVFGNPIAERVDEYYTDDHTFFEESIVLVRAQSFDHAYTLAENRAHQVEHIAVNPYGQTIETKLVDAIDCFEIGESIGTGVEVYSAITPQRKCVTQSGYLKRQYGYNLDDYTENTRRKEAFARLQTVISYEEFSQWRKT